MSEPIIAKWLDDRASLTEDEAFELQRALDADPALAQRVKDQLVTDDLLSRRLAVDRGNFETQIAQRIVNPGSDRSFTRSILEAVRRTDRRRASWRSRAPEAAAAALLIAGLMFLLLRRLPDSVPAATGPAGLKAEYFRSRDLRGSPVTRKDSVIDFEWAKGAGPLEGWRDIFSARWTGKMLPKYSERYTFRTQNDDGVRVWIDGKLVIDDWKGRPVVVENRGEIQLEAGKACVLKVEYFNGGDLGVLRLYWSSPSQKEEIVPSTQLSSP